MKLLLVDDDVFLRDMYVVKFTEAGHKVDTAENGVSALSKLNQVSDYDIVLLDMVMPGMNGDKLIQNCLERFEDRKTKYIVLSNQGQDEDIKEAMRAGATAYIIKAESVPSEVVDKVERIFSNKEV